MKVYTSNKGIKVVTTEAGVSKEGRKNDCTVRALFNVMPDSRFVSYEECEQMLARAGRPLNEGCTIHVWHNVYQNMGLRVVGTFGTTADARAKRSFYRNNGLTVPHYKGMTVATALGSFLKHGRYVVAVDRHVMAVVDGKIIEKGGLSRAGKRVHAIYKYDPA